MTLNNNQLATIGVYVSRDCKYPDLQVEIAGHIKYRIQDMMTADGRLQLEDAYIMVRMEFGDNSFNIFEESKKAALRNKYRNLFLKRLMAQLNLKYAVACATIMLWLYLFYTEARLPGISSGLLSFWPSFLPFLPIYAITLTTRVRPARKYKTYHTLGVSNEVLFKWIYIYMFAFVLYFGTGVFARENKFLMAAITGGIAAIIIIIVFRAGYAVRRAAIDDCREIATHHQISLV